MKCTYCNTDNESDGKFCIKCGSPLAKKGQKRAIEEVLFVPKQKPSHTFRNLLLVIGVIIVVLSLIGLLGSSGNTAQKSEEPFYAVDNGFKVLFPTYPQTERSAEEKVNGRTYSYTQYTASEGNDYAYMVQVANYDIAPYEYDNKNGLEGIVNGMVKTGENDLLNSSFTKFKGYDAVNFSIKSIKENILIDGVAFIKDDLQKIRAYILIFSSKYGDQTKLNSFINSFELTQ